MANNTTALQGPILLATQLELVTPTTVAGTFYGIAFTLFCLYVHSLVPRLQGEDRKKQAQFMLGYTSIIMLCGLCTLVSNAWVTQDAYIKHGDYPGGPYGYIPSTFHTQAIIAVVFTCQLAIDILTSAIQIWRVWVIWNATRYAKLVVVLPLLCLLTYAALVLRTIVLNATLPITGVSLLDTKTQLAELPIQAATTILCTVLISVYLTYEHWRQRKLIGEAYAGSAGYMKVLAILIESYTLESLWILVQAPLYSHPVGLFWGEGRQYIEIIAYLLVQYRVVSGTAYESQRAESNVSSLHWNHSNHATTQCGEASEAIDDRHVSDKREADVLQVSSMA
ncbi:hypothetical protein AGABI2DRAFT_121427 [Agaricus bisporus var. bisporus H97]|uniref:hypothetical protein n=1 Tax=Agaricus bisporus var. bisporus (strain H97 / ATCC MYA-4626 / FGSC 10389) TaxID=936046 RepID=UPI00029F7897|nr:hypothetical protein AGABI2DRAFT_121427 [Agaricus bisporus var. bisporus H97]EKV44248.1 hypothetical protein AGABI2DRAFT_121427 [Agaricus bisporus var. bisporus H97]